MLKISKLWPALRTGWKTARSVMRSDLSGRAPSASRAFEGARVGTLFANWMTSATSADQELRGSYRRLIDRIRSLERDSGTVRAYLRAITAEVLGCNGIKFQARVNDLRPANSVPRSLLPIGQRKLPDDWLARAFIRVPDEQANDIIETWWKKLTKKISLDGQNSFSQVCEQLLRTKVRDGTVLLRIYRGPAAENDFGFAIQPLEIDHLDLEFFDAQRRISFGVERSESGRPIAYYIFKSHPGNWEQNYYQARERQRIPADDVILWAGKDRIGQTIGVSELVASITDVKVLDAFIRFELSASAVGAATMGFISHDPDGPPGDNGFNEGTNARGETVQQLEGGTVRDIGTGKFTGFTPNHPNTNAWQFIKAILHGFAAGAGAAYTAISADMSEANYSSERVAMLQVREPYKMIQKDMIESICIPIFEHALLVCLTNQTLPLPVTKYDKFNQPEFTGRRWPWIDPQNEVAAVNAAIANGLLSRTKWCKENDQNFDENIQQLAEEVSLADEYGVKLIAGKETMTADPAISDAANAPATNQPAAQKTA